MKTPVTLYEIKAKIIIREMIRWAEEVPKGATGPEVALGALMTYYEHLLPTTFYSKIQFTKATSEKTLEHNEHLSQAINNLMLQSWGRFADVCKIVDDLTGDQARDMYENHLQVRPYKDQKPITTELKQPKPKKQTDEFKESVKAFFNAGISTSTK